MTTVYPIATDRNIQLAAVSNLQVSAGATVNILGGSEKIDLSKCVFYYAMIRSTDGSHNFALKSYCYTKAGGSAYDAGTEIVAVTGGTRGVSPEWQQVRSPFLRVDLTNGDADNAHTYIVLVYGIR